MVLIVYLLCSVSSIFLLPAPFILPTSVGHYPECNEYSSCGCPAAIETGPISTATGTICAYDPKSLCFFFFKPSYCCVCALCFSSNNQAQLLQIPPHADQKQRISSPN